MPPFASFDHAVIITGPTASGKSSLALTLAEEYGGEIVSMDSMALYRGMDIGTAKPNHADLQRVTHHLVNCLDPWESSSVAWWLKEADRAVRGILERGKLPIIVGGTPLYLKAIMYGLFEGPVIEPALRNELEALPAEVLHQQLISVDPAAASRIHPNDHKRLVRALEVYRQTGQPLSTLQQQFQVEPRPRTLPILCLDISRNILYERINLRVDTMMQAGWLEEVRLLMTLDKPLGKEAAQAAGYRELIAHLRGESILTEAVEATKTRSRQLAKRQLTWFRHLPSLEMIAPNDVQQRVTAYISSITPAIGSFGSPL